MKAVILAGGLGSRLSEETTHGPSRWSRSAAFPILWHIMKIYSAPRCARLHYLPGLQGLRHQGIFRQLLPALRPTSPSTCANNTMEVHQNYGEPWRVTLIDTGGETQTGGRIKRILPYVKDEEAFCLTYGDGVADVDITPVDRVPQTAWPAGDADRGAAGRTFRFAGDEGDTIAGFPGKAGRRRAWINGGFFVLSPKVGDTSRATRLRSSRIPEAAGAEATSCGFPSAASGSRWTRCARRTSWKSCGLGKSGVEDLEIAFLTARFFQESR